MKSISEIFLHGYVKFYHYRFKISHYAIKEKGFRKLFHILIFKEKKAYSGKNIYLYVFGVLKAS